MPGGFGGPGGGFSHSSRSVRPCHYGYYEKKTPPGRPKPPGDIICVEKYPSYFWGDDLIKSRDYTSTSTSTRYYLLGTVPALNYIITSEIARVGFSARTNLPGSSGGPGGGFLGVVAVVALPLLLLLLKPPPGPPKLPPDLVRA